jgi:hypothetical protein
MRPSWNVQSDMAKGNFWLSDLTKSHLILAKLKKTVNQRVELPELTKFMSFLSKEVSV